MGFDGNDYSRAAVGEVSGRHVSRGGGGGRLCASHGLNVHVPFQRDSLGTRNAHTWTRAGPHRLFQDPRYGTEASVVRHGLSARPQRRPTAEHENVLTLGPARMRPRPKDHQGRQTRTEAVRTSYPGAPPSAPATRSPARIRGQDRTRRSDHGATTVDAVTKPGRQALRRALSGTNGDPASHFRVAAPSFRPRRDRDAVPPHAVRRAGTRDAT
jgi:hypothetical protein